MAKGECIKCQAREEIVKNIFDGQGIDKNGLCPPCAGTVTTTSKNISETGGEWSPEIAEAMRLR